MKRGEEFSAALDEGRMAKDIDFLPPDAYISIHKRKVDVLLVIYYITVPFLEIIVSISMCLLVIH